MALINTYSTSDAINGEEHLLGAESDGTTTRFKLSDIQSYLSTSVQSTTVFSSIDVNGGAIDGAIIGANSAAASSFTTVAASGNVTIGGTATSTGLITGNAGVTTTNLTITGDLNL